MSKQASKLRCAFGAALIGLLAVTRFGSGQEPREWDGRPPSGREFRGGGPPPFPRFDLPTETTVSRGYIFNDGEYVPTPYEIRFADGVLTINGRRVTAQPPPPRSYGGRGFGPPRGGENAWRSAVVELQGQLTNDGVMLSFAKQPLILLDNSTTYDLLKSMIAQDGRSLRQVSLVERLPADFDKQIWESWISNFKVPDELRARAASLVNSYDLAQARAASEIRARKWLESLSYPLSVGSMVMSVLAIGHLLGGRPHAGKPTNGIDVSPEMIRALNWSLFFVATFSAIDLAWTILAAGVNQMHELNPIGSHLIDNPRHLAGFKIGVTLPSIGLLWLLRKHKRAQVAAWWVCLILTLVTVRWLLLSSMYSAA
jgi:hypothetical protein